MKIVSFYYSNKKTCSAKETWVRAKVGSVRPKICPESEANLPNNPLKRITYMSHLQSFLLHRKIEKYPRDKNDIGIDM